MQASDLLVEVRDRSLTRVGQIKPEHLDLKATIAFNGPGAWSLRLPTEHPMVAHLRTPGAGLIVNGPDGVLLSGPMTSSTVSASLSDLGGMVEIEGVTDDALLWRRAAYPTPTSSDVGAQVNAYDVRTGFAATVMQDYVRANIGSRAPAARRVTALAVSIDGPLGPQVTKSARFDVLGDLLTEIALVAGLRFRLVQVGAALRFEVLEITDRRATVRFDLRNGTLSSHEYAQSTPGLTRAIVAGQGQGEERTLIERTTAEAIAAEALWGPFGRVERFIDQRNTDELDELQQAGDKALAEDGFSAVSVKAVASDDLTMRFAHDWNVGDAVTVVVDGQEVSSTVTKATVIVNSTATRVGAEIGDVTGFSVADALGRRVEDTEKRVSALERTAEDSELLGTVLRGKVEPYYTQGPPMVTWTGDSYPSGPYPYLANGWRPSSGADVLGITDVSTGDIFVQPVAFGPYLTPTWYPLALRAPWSNYGGGYATTSVTRTASGIVKVKGLIAASDSSAAPGTVIAVLPPTFRPARPMMFAAQNSLGGSSSGSVDIAVNGEIRVRSVDRGWVSLDNIAFPSADRVPDSAWTEATLQSGFSNFPGWAPAGYWKDPHGVVWERGLVARAAGIPPTQTPIYTSPVGYRPQLRQHRRTTAENIHAFNYKEPNGYTSWGSGTAGAGYLSLDGIPFVDVGSPLKWTALPLTNGWADYSSDFPPASWTKTPDGHVHLRGLIRSGTPAGIFATLPPGARPSERLILGTVSNTATARFDITPSGDLVFNVGSNAWLSLDSLNFIAEQ